MPAHADANLMTAGSLAENMSAEQQFAYEAGVVEGMAYARYIMDGKTRDGMNCIYRWFYDGEHTRQHIQQAYQEFPEHTVGPILWALSKRECGE